MGQREKIFEQIKRHKPEEVKHPGEFRTNFPSGNQLAIFASNLQDAGGQCYEASSPVDLIEKARLIYGNKLQFINLSKYLKGSSEVTDIKKADRPVFEENDILVLETILAVAENGAVWFENTHLPGRLAPFEAEKLIVVLHKDNVVSNMHHAYRRLRAFDYGVFISGPSKTADIEQSLVVGAQATLSLTVFLVD